MVAPVNGDPLSRMLCSNLICTWVDVGVGYVTINLPFAMAVGAVIVVSAVVSVFSVLVRQCVGQVVVIAVFVVGNEWCFVTVVGRSNPAIVSVSVAGGFCLATGEASVEEPGL